MSHKSVKVRQFVTCSMDEALQHSKMHMEQVYLSSMLTSKTSACHTVSQVDPIVWFYLILCVTLDLTAVTFGLHKLPACKVP